MKEMYSDIYNTLYNRYAYLMAESFENRKKSIISHGGTPDESLLTRITVETYDSIIKDAIIANFAIGPALFGWLLLL